MSEKYIIDRVEGNYVIIENENGDIDKISIRNVTGDFKEGDILINIDNKYFKVDKKSTKIRKKQIHNKMKDMWEE
ncbi:hypothetical protein AXY43_12055 [Clostridium sp. MF28]|uniref:DUF3006 domain-containing protein n=1 Tax=Clostridium TaxID=1485 RepID=UPI000CF9960F|nr:MULTISPECIES: DUF3006 domain-containing protein [Clostridium]AVK48721.1 hypothetical protein AXY43_12055 [Clostridium sp. MF28]PSM58602.1 DUF3006 domain-containing protein [Clostridium diolis]